MYNEKQTSFKTPEWDELDREVKRDLVDYTESIEFIKLLINKDRPYASGMPKDEEGKVIPDILNPHILEDMNYFRAAAMHYQESGKYTDLYPNGHPQSEYYKFWQEEARRCREGRLRKDGEWIPGDYYFYLNYSPIFLTLTKKGSKKADRIIDFPKTYDGDYFYYHYIEQAREAGTHGGILKSRGKGFSFKGGSGLAKHFIVGSNTKSNIGVKAFAIALYV